MNSIIKNTIAQAEYKRQCNHDLGVRLCVEQKIEEKYGIAMSALQCDRIAGIRGSVDLVENHINHYLCETFYDKNKNTYCFYSKPHQVWFICSVEFIDNYDPSKTLERLITKKVLGDMVPVSPVSPGLFGFYNKNTQCAFLKLYRCHHGKYRDIDMTAYQPYYGFHQIPEIRMIPTDRLQGCDGSEGANFLLDYLSFMDHIRDTAYIKRPHINHHIQKSLTQTIPNPGDETRDLMVRTSESYDGESVFRLSVSCPTITDTYLKHVDPTFNHRYILQQIETIRDEKWFQNMIVKRLDLEDLVTTVTDTIMTTLVTECYTSTRQKMKRGSCMWNVVDSSTINTTRTVLRGILHELFTNIREDVRGSFDIDTFVSQVYTYLVSRVGFVIDPSDSVWEMDDRIKKFHRDSQEKITKYKTSDTTQTHRDDLLFRLAEERQRLRGPSKYWRLQKNVHSRFTKKISKTTIEMIISSAFNTRFPTLVKSISSEGEGGGEGGGGGGEDVKI